MIASSASRPSRHLLPTAADPTRRLALLLLIVVAHLLIIALLLTRVRSQQVVTMRGLNTLITLAPLSGEQTALPGPKRDQPPRSVVRAPTPAPIIALPSLLSATVLDAGAAQAVTPGGGGCQLAGEVGTAIQESPKAMGEIAALPPSVRTEADAVMMWNGSWVAQASLSSSDLPPLPGGMKNLRLTIEGVVAAASAECREASMSGPVLVQIPEGERTTMLVIGSGVWRWDDMAADPASCLAEDIPQCSMTTIKH